MHETNSRKSKHVRKNYPLSCFEHIIEELQELLRHIADSDLILPMITTNTSQIVLKMFFELCL